MGIVERMKRELRSHRQDLSEAQICCLAEEILGDLLLQYVREEELMAFVAKRAAEENRAFRLHALS